MCKNIILKDKEILFKVKKASDKTFLKKVQKKNKLKKIKKVQ